MTGGLTNATDIHPRSAAAADMRDALTYAEWLATESAARGKELSWDAAVIAGASMVVSCAVEGMHECMHGGPDESGDDT